MEISLLIIGLAAGILIGWLLGKFKQTPAANSSNEKIIELTRELATQTTINKSLEEKLKSQKVEVENLKKSFSSEFENLANKILEEKSKKFAEQNKTNLENILNPLKENITKFEKKVDETYRTEANERNSLKGEIKMLMTLNKQISEEANNLAKALKGDAKKQGNWGEIILEKVLERSGLQKGIEYEMQVSMNTEDGKHLQPDVIVKLPDNKHIVIDSKVSLTAYESFCNVTVDEEREKYLQSHITSVKTHIKGLSEKNYHSLNGINSPDFVLLFMPIESSFSLAVQADNELFNYAWERKIVIVSPSTLLATLRTISSIWKQERQTHNALEIARQSGELYDKFVGFLGDLVEVGKKMDATKKTYEDAMNKFSSGRGNLIKRAETIKELGAKTTKDIPPSLIERANEA
ncbi:MAG: DNA recombination protein RmuC [Bacteroidetes bacterium]|nr:DNA recombination protein RmuC [Bacteroidota bacterium]